MSLEPARPLYSNPRNTSVQRKSYLDNLRLLFAVLVILHHVCLSYTGEKGWYYYDVIADPFTNLFVVLLMTINRTWVLQCFFLISGYLTPSSLYRKGLRVYINQRLMRIGIPLAIFMLFIRPSMYYVTHRNELPYPFLESLFTLKYVDAGPAWFLEALLVFSLIYGLIWALRKPGHRCEGNEKPFPGNYTIFLFISALTIVSFVFHIYLPGHKKIFHFRPGNFADYIAFFAVGICGYRNRWLDKLTDRTGLQWTLITAAAIVCYGAFTVTSWTSHENLSYMRGGMSLKTLITTWIGTHIAVGISISSLYLFRKFCDIDTPLIRAMAKDAYAVFIFHSPVVIAVTYAIHGLALSSFLKFTTSFLLSTILSFLICRYVLRKIPFSDKFL